LLAENGRSASLGVLQWGDTILNSSSKRGAPWMNVSEPRGWIIDGGIAWIGGKMEAWSRGDGKIGS